MSRFSVAAALIGAALLVLPTWSFAQTQAPPVAQGSAAARPADLLNQPVSQLGTTIDAYAAASGVSRGEAVRRLGRIQAALRLAERLQSVEADNFAGVRITHGRNFRVAMRFKREGERVLRERGAAFDLAPDAELVADASPVSIAELLSSRSAIAAAVETARASALVEIADDGGLLITTTDRAALDAALASARIALPSYARIEVRPQLFDDVSLVPAAMRVRIPVPNTSQVGVCSAGFAIRERSTGTAGFATAGHCQNYVGTVYGVAPDTTSIAISAARGERVTNGYDFQWHTVAAPHGVSPSVNLYNGTYALIYYYWPTASISAGMTVTVVGSVTRRAIAATIQSGVGTSLGTYGCCFYRVTPVNYDDILVQDGDSGGVVYAGNTAVGILKARTADIQNDAWFMPIQSLINAGYDVIPASQ